MSPVCPISILINAPRLAPPLPLPPNRKPPSHPPLLHLWCLSFGEPFISMFTQHASASMARFESSMLPAFVPRCSGFAQAATVAHGILRSRPLDGTLLPPSRFQSNLTLSSLLSLTRRSASILPPSSRGSVTVRRKLPRMNAKPRKRN